MAGASVARRFSRRALGSPVRVRISATANPSPSFPEVAGATAAIMEAIEPWRDEPPIKIQGCPLCGGKVAIGPAGMERVGNGHERWSESCYCAVCETALVRELAETDKPVAFMKRLDWRPSS